LQQLISAITYCVAVFAKKVIISFNLLFCQKPLLRIVLLLLLATSEEKRVDKYNVCSDCMRRCSFL